jgi:hypothetical protein
MRTLNSYLMVEDSPIVRNEKVSPLKSIDTLDLQQTRFKATTLNIRNLIWRSGIDSGATGTISGSAAVVITYGLQPNAHQPNKYALLGVPFVGVYIGTAAVGTAQVFPYIDDDSNNGKLEFQAAFDYPSFNSRDLVFRINARNLTADAVPIYINARWLYSQNGGGIAA